MYSDMEIVLNSIIKQESKKTSKKNSLIYSEYFIKLINLSLSHQEVCELTGLKYNTVQTWRRRNIPVEIFEKYFSVSRRYTEKEILLLKQGRYKELNRSELSIHFKCKSLKIDRSNLKNKQSLFTSKLINKQAINRFKPYTLKELNLILNNEYNAKELACMLGRTVTSIYSIKNNYLRKEGKCDF